jgi:hypothetical protein
VNITDIRPNYKRVLLRRPAGSRNISLALIVIACTVATGCVAPKRASFVVPRRCMKINVQSFTRPCAQRADGKLVCDGVVLTATCIEASH